LDRISKNKQAELTIGSSFGSSAIFNFLRPVAFCPLLTEGLALSGIKQKASEGTKNPLEASRWHLLETPLHTAPKKVRGQVVKLIGDKWESVT
jgi:hypothetical protein